VNFTLEHKMKVIDHEPGLWFLLGDDDRLFLDVNCEHSAVGYTVLIELDESERAQQTAQGRAYLSKLAEAINYSAPGARGSQSSYKSRNISSQYGAQVSEAIRAWRSRQEQRVSR
jgi:hypothetical protein